MPDPRLSCLLTLLAGLTSQDHSPCKAGCQEGSLKEVWEPQKHLAWPDEPRLCPYICHMGHEWNCRGAAALLDPVLVGDSGAPWECSLDRAWNSPDRPPPC